MQSAADLATNLSKQGYGAGYAVATELQNQIREIIDVLSDEEIRDAYGARDMWQVLEAVSSSGLNDPKDSYHYRILAMSGAIIIRWLADRTQRLSLGERELLDLHELTESRSRGSGQAALTNPSDRDLVYACYQWLQVSGSQPQGSGP
jgi:hypothetical protein